MIKVPFHRPSISEEEICAVTDVLRSGWLTMGEKTFEFEQRFAEYIGCRHAIAVSSGTAALHLSLEAIDLHPDDEVLIPTNTFTATAEVVAHLKARPVLVDIDPTTLNIDPVDAACKITPRTKAIIPVHLAGQPCNMHAIQQLADSRNLHIIEDAAHALPSSYRHHRIGTISELTAFSFYANKTLTTGEGGMVTTDSDSHAERIRKMRLHGITRDAWSRYSAEGVWHYEVTDAGYKYNLTDMQAAIGLVQLKKCDAMHAARCRIAERYKTAFERLPELEVPRIAVEAQTSWHLYILRLRLDHLHIDRNRFIAELQARGVHASVHFIPLHLQPYYQQSFGYRAGDLPQAEREYLRCLSLPIFPGMTEQEIEHVIGSVIHVCQQFSRSRRIA